jgi:hypothetical protein
MTIAQFESLFRKACDKYGVKVFFGDTGQEEDNGCAIWNEVHLAPKYSCLSVYMAVAFHELGHAIINTKRSKGIKLYKVHSNFNNEFNAWWLAQRLYMKYIGRPFTKKMGDFALECLKTHSASHYSFKNTFDNQ